MEEGIKIEKVVSGIETNYVHIKTHGRRKCPDRGEFSNKVHQKKLQEIAERPLSGKKVKYVVERRRFKCLNPECDRKTFTEEFHGSKRCGRRTQIFKELIHYYYKKMSGKEVKEILEREYGTRISEATIYRDFVEISKEKEKSHHKDSVNQPPKRINIDEFSKGNGHNSFATLIMDIDRERTLDIQKGKSKRSVKEGRQLSRILCLAGLLS